MADYLDNHSNANWSWEVDPGKSAQLIVHHDHPKAHNHTLDVTNVSVEEMVTNTNTVLGEAHRASPHTYLEESTMQTRNDFLAGLRADKATISKTNEVSKNFKNEDAQNSSKSADNGGRERADDGPVSHGRESENKSPSHSQVGAIRSDMVASAKPSSQGRSGQTIGKTNAPTHSQVAAIRADMVASAKTSPQGRSGQTVGKTNAPTHSQVAAIRADMVATTKSTSQGRSGQTVGKTNAPAHTPSAAKGSSVTGGKTAASSGKGGVSGGSVSGSHAAGSLSGGHGATGGSAGSGHGGYGNSGGHSGGGHGGH